jgi:hypothetical protein
LNTLSYVTDQVSHPDKTDKNYSWVYWLGYGSYDRWTGDHSP